MTSTTPPEIAAKVESYIPRFTLTRLLNQDQAGRRISLLGTVDSQPALLIAERAAFATDTAHLQAFPTTLTRIKNLGANDIYSWFLANSNVSAGDDAGSLDVPPDYKLNLIYPCTEKHIKKYSAQGLRIVTETPSIYASYVRPWIQKQREKGTLNWVFNIIEGRTEQEDVIYRETGQEGFLLLPDLNWDRKTMAGLHLLGIVERRDIWSVRDLKKGDVEWVKHMREKLLDSTVKLYPEIEKDQLKLYVHCEFCFPCSLLARVLICARSTYLPPFSYSHCPCHAGSRSHASRRQSSRSREHHFDAGIIIGRQLCWYAGCEPDVPSGGSKRAMGESIQRIEAGQGARRCKSLSVLDARIMSGTYRLESRKWNNSRQNRHIRLDYREAGQRSNSIAERQTINTDTAFPLQQRTDAIVRIMGF